MASVFEVSNWFLEKEPMTHKKLQKLCYYAQAWHCALHDDKRLINEDFQAWVHGPVCPVLYSRYSGFGWDPIDNTNKVHLEANNLTKEKVGLLESVWDTYGEFDGDELESISHSEVPWRKQREGLKPWELSNNTILCADMGNYYRSIYSENQND